MGSGDWHEEGRAGWLRNRSDTVIWGPLHYVVLLAPGEGAGAGGLPVLQLPNMGSHYRSQVEASVLIALLTLWLAAMALFADELWRNLPWWLSRTATMSAHRTRKSIWLCAAPT